LGLRDIFSTLILHNLWFAISQLVRKKVCSAPLIFDKPININLCQTLVDSLRAPHSKGWASGLEIDNRTILKCGAFGFALFSKVNNLAQFNLLNSLNDRFAPATLGVIDDALLMALRRDIASSPGPCVGRD
jgi:hypothetical protein